MEDSDEQVITSEKTESKHELRPCYLMLRGLALWQPKNANKLYRFYNICGYIFLICLVGFVLFSFSEKSIAKEKLLWKSVLNGVIFSATCRVLLYEMALLSWQIQCHVSRAQARRYDGVYALQKTGTSLHDCGADAMDRLPVPVVMVLLQCNGNKSMVVLDSLFLRCCVWQW